MRVSRQRQSAQAMPRMSRTRLDGFGYRLTGEGVNGAGIAAVGEDGEGGSKLIPQDAGPEAISGNLNAGGSGLKDERQKRENIGGDGQAQADVKRIVRFMVLRDHGGFIREDQLFVGTLVEGLRVVQVIDEPGRDEANAGYDKNDRLAEVVGDGARLLGNGGADRGEASRVRGELADEAIGDGQTQEGRQ